MVNFSNNRQTRMTAAEASAASGKKGGGKKGPITYAPAPQRDPHTTVENANVAQPTQPTPPSPLTYGSTGAQSQGQAEVGANFLMNGNPDASQFDTVFGDAIGNSRDALGRINQYIPQIQNFLQNSIDPTRSYYGSGMETLMNKFGSDRQADVDAMYAPDSANMNDFRKRIAGERAEANQSGLFGSREKAAVEGQVTSDLIGRRAGEMQTANNLTRSDIIAALGGMSDANMSSAGIYRDLSGQDLSAAQNFLAQAGNVAAGKSGADLGYRNMGADVLNQGIAGQNEAIKGNAALQQQQFEQDYKRWEGENMARQQILENLIAKYGRKKALEMMDKMEAQAQEDKDNENSWWDPLGTVT
jgi:hypothetical protein